MDSTETPRIMSIAMCAIARDGLRLIVEKPRVVAPRHEVMSKRMSKPYRSHDEAVSESLRADPAFAAEYLNAVIEDGDQAELSVVLRQRPVVSCDAYCDNVLDPLWYNYGEDSIQYQTALAAYRQIRQRPVVDDAMVERALAGMLAHRGTFEGESQIEADDIRAALLAAYQQDNGLY